MTWQGDPRTTTTAWRTARQAVLHRDQGICHVCGQPGADQVDHQPPWAELQRQGVAHEDQRFLFAIHARPCHRRKTALEGAKARWRQTTTRPTEQHPGLR